MEQEHEKRYGKDVTLRADGDLHARLKVAAAEQRRPLRDVTNDALARYLEDMTKNGTDRGDRASRA